MRSKAMTAIGRQSVMYLAFAFLRISTISCLSHAVCVLTLRIQETQSECEGSEVEYLIIKSTKHFSNNTIISTCLAILE